MEDGFLVQVLDKTMRNEELLDRVLANVDQLIKGVKIDGKLGCSNLALIEFVISRSKVKTLKTERLMFQLFRG